ncbi:hypothetical protein B0O99DRAFT_684025 [Bisporella sp. PMI_857]|nr:hypothetical protein B0O99DRAFT_684025 [Bisporella sp. PMI_857]
MASLAALGAVSSVITVLETTLKVFDRITQIVSRISQFKSQSQSIIRQCQFDSGTLKIIIGILKANPQVFESTHEADGLANVFYELQIQLFKTKAQVEAYEEDSGFRRVAWGLSGANALEDVERDLFRWSQRLYIRFSVIISRFQGLMTTGSKGSTTLLRVPEIFSQYEMRQVATKARSVDKTALLKDISKDGIVVSGNPSSQMTGRINDGKPNSSLILVEFKPYSNANGPSEKAEMEDGVALLAAIFQNVKPDLMNILRCCGYYDDAANSRFGILYSIDRGSGEFATLDTLIATAPQHPINKRFEIARRVTAAVVFTHGVGWVHKAIRTRKVLLFPFPGSSVKDPDFSSKLGDAYVSGFEDARTMSGKSNLKESESWQSRLYKHPERQEATANTYFSTTHDIYSLGVVLLEIALWKQLERQTISVSQGPGLPRKEAYVFENSDAMKTKKALLMYASTIDRIVGPTYQQLVIRCLQVDDQSANGIKFISEVLGHLENLSVAL